MKSLPKGIIVFAIIAALDAIVSILFMIFLATVPEAVTMLTDNPVPDLFADYKLLGEVFNEHQLEGFTLVVIIDTLMVIGLLSHKPWSRNMVIGCNILGVIFNVSIINFPGLIFNTILLWYMLKASTKEYYLNTI